MCFLGVRWSASNGVLHAHFDKGSIKEIKESSQVKLRFYRMCVWIMKMRALVLELYDHHVRPRVAFRALTNILRSTCFHFIDMNSSMLIHEEHLGTKICSLGNAWTQTTLLTLPSPLTNSTTRMTPFSIDRDMNSSVFHLSRWLGTVTLFLVRSPQPPAQIKS